MKRRAPMLSTLPLREVDRDATRAGAGTHGPPRVKLRLSEHKGHKRAVPQVWAQLTVPADMASVLPPDAVFEVRHVGREIRYRLVDRC